MAASRASNDIWSSPASTPIPNRKRNYSTLNSDRFTMANKSRRTTPTPAAVSSGFPSQSRLDSNSIDIIDLTGYVALSSQLAAPDTALTHNLGMILKQTPPWSPSRSENLKDDHKRIEIEKWLFACQVKSAIRHHQPNPRHRMLSQS
jgi:hypothetical protein